MPDSDQDLSGQINTVVLATDITAAWLANPNTRSSAEDVPTFLTSIHDALSLLAVPDGPPIEASQAPAVQPAVSARKSLASADHIVSMIDGKPYRTLTRHLAKHGLTPAEYRQRFGLKADYPMVARGYSEARRAMAKELGLGRKAKTTIEVPTNSAPATTRRNAAQSK